MRTAMCVSMRRRYCTSIIIIMYIYTCTILCKFSRKLLCTSYIYTLKINDLESPSGDKSYLLLQVSVGLWYCLSRRAVPSQPPRDETP